MATLVQSRKGVDVADFWWEEVPGARGQGPGPEPEPESLKTLDPPAKWAEGTVR